MASTGVTISGGAIDLNIDSRGIIKDTISVMYKSGLLGPILIGLGVVLVLGLLRARLDGKIREYRERKKAKIWKQEYKDK